MWGCEKVWGRCGRLYGVSVEDVGKCVRVWRQVKGEVRGCGEVCWGLGAEMGIYRNNLSAIVIGDNLLSIIVIA